MFKKQLFSALAFLFTVGMVFNTTPAFASGGVTTPATITSIAALQNPSQFKITGTLPVCDSLVVSNPDVAGLAISIYLRGSHPMGVTCAMGSKAFSTIVTLDPVKLKLAPGIYTVLVNPVNGKSPFTASFMVGHVVYTGVTIKSLSALRSFPPQFKITGSLPKCDSLVISNPAVAGSVISIYLRGIHPMGVTCAMGSKAFSTTVTIDPVKLKLAPGNYAVLVNPVNGKSQFKSTLIVP